MDSLTLHDVLYILEHKGNLVAFDMGEHMHCTIDSNCPRAVELRKIITELNIDYKTLTMPEEQSTILLNIDSLPPISTTVVIGGTEIDVSNLIKEDVLYKLRNLITQVENNRSRVVRLGQSYNSTYHQEVSKLRRQGRLPQLSFNLGDMVKYDCRITTDAEAKTYLICFGVQYRPQWAYHDGSRYAISPTYAKMLERDVFLVFQVNKTKNIVHTSLVDSTGRKFQHYHGNDMHDCWGQNEMPRVWDGTLKQLGEKAYSLSRAIATVNLDSLLNREPAGFPTAAELRKHLKLLGEEGKMPTEDAPAERTPAPTPTRRWGER